MSLLKFGNITVQQKTLTVKKLGEKSYYKALAEKTLAKKHVSFRAIN